MKDYKVLLLDFDGVLSPGKLFSEIYSEEFNLPVEKMMPLFNELTKTATVGKGDLVELIKKHISNWNWKGSIDEFVEYWMNADADIDESVVEWGKIFKGKGGRVYLASDQERHRADFIWNKRGLSDWMDGKFISCELGVSKNSPEFFAKVVESLKIQPEEIVYFDDSQSKIDSALSVGVQAYLYKDIDDLINNLK